MCYTKWLNIFYPPKKKAQHMCFYGQNLVNSIFFEKYSVNSMQLKVFSKLDCFLKIEFVKLKFQSKIEFPKLNLDLTWIKKRKKEKVEIEFSKLKFHAFKKRVRLLSSEFFHWTWPDLDTCPRVDTCPRSNVFSEKIHWTQALPLKK